MDKLRQPYFIYLVAISLCGLLIVAAGLWQIPGYQPQYNFFLLLLLAAVAEAAATSVRISDQGGITFEVGTAVCMSAIPFYGPFAAAVAVAVSSLSIWLIKPVEKATWKKSWEQLAFNIGMHSLAIFAAGFVFLGIQEFLAPYPLLAQLAPWLPAAVVYDQTNFWLLMGILRLQHGTKVHPWEIWAENRWAMPINIIVLAAGGAFLAYAIERFDWTGIIVFFLPILLSAYAFRLYVHQMQEHMDNLEAIVAERTRELRELSREKDAFLAVLTHDMKAPLTSIGLYVDLIEKRPGLLQERPHMTQIIQRSQKTLLDIVNNILDLEKLQTGGTVSLDKEHIDLTPLIEHVVEALKPMAAEKRIQIELEINTETILVDADRQQMERILMNLVSNAIKYTDVGGHICVAAEHGRETVAIEIRDTGYGIPADELPYIFERFRRVDKHSTKAVGTGLGLAITRALVEAHGGEITVESEEDVGSCFRIILPIN